MISRHEDSERLWTWNCRPAPRRQHENSSDRRKPRRLARCANSIGGGEGVGGDEVDDGCDHGGLFNSIPTWMGAESENGARGGGGCFIVLTSSRQRVVCVYSNVNGESRLFFINRIGISHIVFIHLDTGSWKHWGSWIWNGWIMTSFCSTPLLYGLLFVQEINDRGDKIINHLEFCWKITAATWVQNVSDTEGLKSWFSDVAMKSKNIIYFLHGLTW